MVDLSHVKNVCPRTESHYVDRKLDDQQGSHETIMNELPGKLQPNPELNQSLHSKNNAVTLLRACGGSTPKTALVYTNTNVWV